MKLGLFLFLLSGFFTNFAGWQTASPTTPATLVFVGDIMLSRKIGEIMAARSDWQYPFREIKNFLAEADLSIGNLEGPISSRGAKVGSVYSFRADPRAVAGLTGAGFDVLSLANNHIWDYGRDAFSETLQILEAAGIDYIGGGIDAAEAHRPLIREVKGTKVAFLAYTDLVPVGITRENSKPAVAFLALDQIIPDIEKAKALADITVVVFHWGEEYETKQNQWQETIAHAVIDAGANLVVGHHPHVVQAVEEYHGGHIAYSLGNFVFDQNFSKFSNGTKSGLILKVSLQDKKITKVEPHTIEFTDTYQPVFVD